MGLVTLYEAHHYHNSIYLLGCLSVYNVYEEFGIEPDINSVR